MTAAIRLHQNDYGILLTFLCRDEDGSPVDLTTFAVDFFLLSGDTILNSGRSACTKPDSVLGLAEYLVSVADTQQVGIFQGRLCLQNGSSEVRSVSGITLEIRR